MRALVAGCMMQGVLADTSRQLFGAAPAPGLRGGAAWTPQMASFPGPAIDPGLYSGHTDSAGIEWSPESFAIPVWTPEEPQRTSVLDTTTGLLLGAAAGALAGYAMLGTGGSAVLSAASREERAKHAWLASLDAPAWGSVAPNRPAPGRPAARRVASTRAAPAWSRSQTDDHTNPGSRLAASTFGRVPIATSTPVDALFGDDHTNPGERLAVNGYGRVPIATFKPTVEMIGDDHTHPGNRLAVNGYGRVPMARSATPVPVARSATPAGGTVRQGAGTAEERAKRAWLSKLDQPSWGRR